MGDEETRKAAQAALRDIRQMIDEAGGRVMENVDRLSALVRNIDERVSKLEGIEPVTIELPCDVVEASRRHEADKVAAARPGKYAMIAAKGPPPGVPLVNRKIGAGTQAEPHGYQDPMAIGVRKLEAKVAEAREAAKVAQLEAIQWREEASAAKHELQMAREQLGPRVPADIERHEKSHGGNWIACVASTIDDLRKRTQFAETERNAYRSSCERLDAKIIAMAEDQRRTVAERDDLKRINDTDIPQMSERIRSLEDQLREQSSLVRQSELILELHKPQQPLSAIALEAQLERTRTDLDARCEEIAAVWKVLEPRDEFGTPHGWEPGLDDTTPAEAVSRAMTHLRETLSRRDRQIDELQHEMGNRGL